jgi:predicted nucleic acid-binding protein
MPDVISNTSCLIALSNISMPDILKKRYGRVLVTAEVFAALRRVAFRMPNGFEDRYL